MESKRATIRFPPKMKAQLDDLARLTGATVNFSVVAAVRAYLERPEIKSALKKRGA